MLITKMLERLVSFLPFIDVAACHVVVRVYRRNIEGVVTHFKDVPILHIGRHENFIQIIIDESELNLQQMEERK